MARIMGPAARTALSVEADRLAWPPASPHAAVNAALCLAAAVLGAGLPDGAHKSAAPLVLLAALAGTVWLLAGAAGAARLLGRVSPAALHAAAAAGDVSLALSSGVLLGWLVRMAHAQVIASSPEPPNTPLVIPAWAAPLIPIAAAVAVSALAWARASGGALALARLRAGLAGERAVERALQALPDSYVVVSNIVLRSREGRQVEADHVVLGPTGIAVIETKRWGGTVSPGPQEWTVSSGTRVSRRPNPCPRLLAAREAVETALNAPPGSAMPILVLVGGRLASRPKDLVTVVEGTGGLAIALSSRAIGWSLSVSPDEAASILANAAR